MSNYLSGVCLVAVVSIVTFFATPWYIDWRIKIERKKIVDSGKPLAWFDKQGGELAYIDGNHFHVIALTELIWEDRLRSPERLDLEESLGMLSSYYGQGNRLLRQVVKAPLGLVFHARAFVWRHRALSQLTPDLETCMNSSALEVLWAPIFLLANVPHFGTSSYLERAVRAHKQALAQSKKLGEEHTLSYALIASKLYRLTGDYGYFAKVSHVPINEESHPGVVARVAKHLGITREQLYALCAE